MITRNEADRVARAIRSVPFADEVIVVDASSSDRTREVAAACGATVVDQPWLGFVGQRNRALALARSTFVLVLDADEWLEAPAAAVVQQAVRDGVNAASLPRRNRWLGRVLTHGREGRDHQVRFFRRASGRWVGDAVHERLEVQGAVVRLAATIEHDPYRSVVDHLRTVDRYATLHAVVQRERGVRATRRQVVGRAVWHFGRAYLLNAGFRDGVPGLAVATIGAAGTALKWQRTRWR